MKWRVMPIFMLIALGCSHAEDGAQVSMISVISNPTDYDGEEVTITGWLESFGPGEYVLFFSEEHAAYMDTGNGMPVENKWRSEAGYSLDYCPFGPVFVTGTVSIQNNYPALTDLHSAAFFYEDESGVNRIGCRQDVGIRAREFLGGSGM